MFDHVGLRVSDRSASESFYRRLLGVLGIEPDHAGEDFVEWDDFSIGAADAEHPVTRHLHIGFVAADRAAVDAFWRSGIEAGYPNDGEPGPRPQYSEDYYGAFLLDPDGNSVEAVHHEDVRRGGHIDHLWIGVSDLEASGAFYAALAPHIGLRPGRRTEDRIQFRGAWATFSLVGDGRPAIEGLHLAFPAPDPQTAIDFHQAALRHGHPDHGGPGERPEYHPGYFAAYVLDPGGINVESVFHDRRAQWLAARAAHG